MKTVLLYTTFATALHVYFGKLTEITIINQHFIPILTFVMKCLLQKNRIKKGLDFLLMTPPKKIEYFSFASKTKYKTPADRTRPTPPCQITNVNFFTCRYFNSGNPAASLPAEGRCDYKTTSVKSSYRTYFTAFFSLIDIGCCYFITTGPLLFITHGNTWNPPRGSWEGTELSSALHTLPNTIKQPLCPCCISRGYLASEQL